jgi:hypothetical protein
MRGFPAGQRGGRLVHHQDARFLGQRLGDLDNLLMSDAKPVKRYAGIDIGPKGTQNACGFGVDPIAVDRPGNATDKFAPEEYVLRHTEIREPARILEI